MKKIIPLILCAVILLLSVSCVYKNTGTAAIGTGETKAGTAAQTEEQTTADQDYDEEVGYDFSPAAGKLYVAYIYVQYVGEDGFAGTGNFRDGVFVKCQNAADFSVYDTVRIVFDGADYKVETKRCESEWGDFISEQTVEKVKSARRSDFEIGEPLYDKPIIYLYPETDTVCSVRLELNGEFTCTYPDYGKDGWQNFTAKPDGTLVFEDGREYYALYWEGKVNAVFDTSRGFCVKGGDTAAFLSDALPKLGLSAKEANEFIIYWLPRMQGNPYNLIAFQSSAYTESAKLTVEPAPDALIRVFMAYKPLDIPVDIEPQTFDTPQRTGFTVVEWGGSEIK